MTRAVLFDLYGVVMCTQSAEAITAIENAAGFGGPELWQPFWELRDPYDNGLITADEYWAQVAAATDRQIADPAAVIVAEVAGWSNADEQMVAYVRELASRHRVGVASNLPIDVVQMLRATQPWVFELEVVVLSSLFGSGKPQPEIYQQAADDFGLPPADILFVDDRPANVAGAAAIGMPGVVFTTLDELRPEIDAHLAS